MHFDVEAIVTKATDTELKLTGNWPLAWLQAPQSTQIQRKLRPGEAFESVWEQTQRSEIGGNRANWPDLRVGDRVIVRCF